MDTSCFYTLTVVKDAAVTTGMQISLQDRDFSTFNIFTGSKSLFFLECIEFLETAESYSQPIGVN